MRRIMIAGFSLISLTSILLFACGDPTQVSNPISITSPSTGTVWQHYQTGVTIKWTGGNSDNLLIALLDDSIVIDTLASSASNTGSYAFNGYVSPSWGTGSDFRICIIDEIGESGTSSQYSIEEGINEIEVTEPTSSTTWMPEETGTQVEWGDSPGSQIKIELWKSGFYVADYCSWTENDGQYLRNESIPTSWGNGSDFRVIVIDNQGYYGLSEQFSIEGISEVGLVAYYPLNGNANDESGNVHHGEVVGSVDFNTLDRFGTPTSAIDIPDDWSYIRIENHPDLEVQSHTISAWVKHDSGGDNGGIFNNGNQMDHYSLRTASGSIIHVINYPDTGCDHICNTDVLADNNWHHLLVTYDGYTSCIWIDGNMISNHVFNKTITYNIHKRSYIGMNFPGGWDWFEGCIDDIRLFNRTLSETEIQALYHEGGW